MLASLSTTPQHVPSFYLFIYFIGKYINRRLGYGELFKAKDTLYYNYFVYSLLFR